MVRINDDYIIDVDSNCYTLKKETHKTDKKGNPLFLTIGYYGSLDNALLAFCKNNIKAEISCGEFTVSEAIEIIKSEREKIKNIVSTEI